MGTSSLYFSALTTSAKNFVGHRGLSIAIPIAAFGLSSFWEALLAGSPLFTKPVVAEGGNVIRELDVVRLFRFFAVLLGIVGVIGACGLFVIPPHLPKRMEGEATEEDALLPRAEESETSSVISLESAKEEITAEHRPFLTESSTYLFGLVLLVLLGTGEMFINCVRGPACNANEAWHNVTNITTNRRFHPRPRSESTYFNISSIEHCISTSFWTIVRLSILTQSLSSDLSSYPFPRTWIPANFGIVRFSLCSHRMA
jgi:hypothetical protein